MQTFNGTDLDPRDSRDDGLMDPLSLESNTPVMTRLLPRQRDDNPTLPGTPMQDDEDEQENGRADGEDNVPPSPMGY